MTKTRKPKGQLFKCDSIGIVTVDEAANEIGVSTNQFLAMIKRGYVSGVKSLGNVYAVSSNFELRLPDFNNSLGINSKLVARTKFIQPIEPNNAA